MYGSSIWFYWLMCQFLYYYCAVFAIIFLWYNWKLSIFLFPKVYLLFRIILIILFFLFLFEIENCSLKIFEELCWNDDRDCLESVHCFEFCFCSVALTNTMNKNHVQEEWIHLVCTSTVSSSSKKIRTGIQAGKDSRGKTHGGLMFIGFLSLDFSACSLFFFYSLFFI